MLLPVVLVLSVMLAVELVAQHPVIGESSPIAPEIKTYDYPGVFVGIPIVVQQGEYRDTCQCPPFHGGSGSGLTAGVFYELRAPERPLFRLGIAGSVDYRSIVSRYREQELLTFRSRDGSAQYAGIPVEFRQQLDLTLFGIHALPYVRTMPFGSESVALMTGAQLGVWFLGKARHTKSLTQTTVRLPNGEQVELQMSNGGTSAVVRDGDVLGMQRFAANVFLRVEASVELWSSWHFRPGVQYSIPLTDFSTSGGTKLATWFVTLSFARQSR
ncbi:MAG: hypothetical protein N2663_08995 [Chlorobi bacterium]|nr:hypothetical protein [Chlorobiota bacterium]